MKPILNLGSGDNIFPGYHNVDISPLPGVNEVVDLNDPWPWEDHTFKSVYAADIIEHLDDKIHTMNELYRVTAGGGKIDIIVPMSNSFAAHQDPTHVTYWNRNSFWYYENGNIYRDRFAKSYGITARFNVLSSNIFLSPVKEEGEKLRILLEVVK